MPRLAARRYKEVFRLVTDVVRLGGDPSKWTDRLLDGVIELFDAKWAACAVAPIPTDPAAWVRADVSLQRGLSEAEQRVWIEGYWAEGCAYRSEFLRRSVAIPARFVTVRREDVMTDEEWYASDAFRLIHEPIGIDAQLESHLVVVGRRKVFGMAVHRAIGKPAFTPADRRQFRRLHLELARAWKGRIVVPAAEDAAFRDLPPRPRQVLWLLCSGKSEKEIGRELGLSPKTVHNHVVRLHAHFDVHSRGELLARVLSPSVESVDEPGLPPAEMNQYVRRD